MRGRLDEGALEISSTRSAGQHFHFYAPPYVRACVRECVHETRVTERAGKRGTRFACVGHRFITLYCRVHARAPRRDKGGGCEGGTERG